MGWLDIIAQAGGGAGVVAVVAIVRYGGPTLRSWLRERRRQNEADASVRRSEVIRRERVELAAMDHEARRLERTEERLWERLERVEAEAAKCEEARNDCAKETAELRTENTVLAQQVERMRSRLPDFRDDDTITRHVGRIARRTPTPPDFAPPRSDE